MSPTDETDRVFLAHEDCSEEADEENTLVTVEQI
jgi:hypothetical protein